MTDAKVLLWGRQIGAVSWDPDLGYAIFQYTPEFAQSKIEVAPQMMPLRSEPYAFPNLDAVAFHGLPGLLAESLPDKYGHAMIDAWLATQGREPGSFNPVERLCYVGSRGMGALEYEPTTSQPARVSRSLGVNALVQLANRVLNQREGLRGVLQGDDDHEVIEDILHVGTSAGGARAKAILAWSPATGEFRSGQVDHGAGFEPWLIKFDGIQNNRDKELADPQGFGLIEYAYSKLATHAGVEMAACRVHEENGRSHFMTRRFDRTPAGGKRHMQSLGALRHFDYNQPAAYAQEQALQTIRQLGLGMVALVQQFRRAVFNIVARNQDDHVKNIAFLMDKRGEWQLSPAFDVTYAWQPQGAWTRQHQMSVNGKRDGFERTDLLALAETAGIKTRKANDMIEQVVASVRQWPAVAEECGITGETVRKIQRAHRLEGL